MKDQNYNYDLSKVIETIKNVNGSLEYVSKLVEFYEDNYQQMDDEITARFVKLVQTELQSVGKIFSVDNDEN